MANNNESNAADIRAMVAAGYDRVAYLAASFESGTRASPCGNFTSKRCSLVYPQTPASSRSVAAPASLAHETYSKGTTPSQPSTSPPPKSTSLKKISRPSFPHPHLHRTRLLSCADM